MDFQNEEKNKDNFKNNSDIELKEFLIISKFYEEDDGEEKEGPKNSKEIYLPTPESLIKTCDIKLVKEFINFDIQKYKSNFDDNKLNLDNIPFIKNKNILTYILLFLGGINSINTIYDFFDDSVIFPNEECFIDNNTNYLTYLNFIIDYLKNEEQKENIFFNFSDLEPLLKSLDILGINISRNDKNIVYRNIKDLIFSMENNKILVLIAPSRIFWIKHDENYIGKKMYDRNLNNSTNLFYNEEFIKKFFNSIGKHKRCKIGLICSMSKNNLNNSYEGLNIIFNEKKNENKNNNPIIINQDYHDKINDILYKRSMKQIIQYLRNNEYNYFDERNIIIIEGKPDKIGEDTKDNSIVINLYNKEYIESYEEKKELLNKRSDKVIKYINDLLENCEDDIRNYINKNDYNEID